MDSRAITYILMILVMLFISINNYSPPGKFDLYIFIGTISLLIITIGALIPNSGSEKPSKIQLFLLGIYIISVIGYTIFQWYKLAHESKSECGILLPNSMNFHDIQYYLYRIIYLSTLIVLVALLQFKVDKDDFNIKLVPGKYLHYFLFLLPIILPILTEIVNGSVNLVTGEDSNPESLLANFFLGDSKWPEDFGNFRIVMPILFYLLLMFVTIDSSHGFSFSSFWPTKGNTAIYITLFFVVFFSFIMRSIFIQDCSLQDSKNISKIKDEGPLGKMSCIFEKYGGLQTLSCTSLIILLIYHVSNPIYKILFFIIICLGSWGLSTTYILNLTN